MKEFAACDALLAEFAERGVPGIHNGSAVCPNRR
jgi:hypothetical protein